MSQKKAFISGVTKGIGKALASALQSAGYEIWGCASTEQSVMQFSESFPEANVRQADLREKTAVFDLADDLLGEAGRFDLLINNAGVFIPGQIHSESDETFEQIMALNLNAAYYLTKRLLPPMLETAAGDIVNICSTASITPYVNGGSYCISKFAQLGFSRVLREELKPKGIRVFSVLPGPTYTASWEGADLPPDRFVQPEDVAKATLAALQLPRGTVVEELIIRPQEGDIG